MIFRNIDPQGDWTFGRGKSNYSRDLDALKLDLSTRLKSWKNDCFFALGEGVDYNALLDRGTQFLLEEDIRRVIFQTQGVIKIEKYESSSVADLREYKANVTIQTVYGRVFQEVS